MRKTLIITLLAICILTHSVEAQRRRRSGNNNPSGSGGATLVDSGPGGYTIEDPNAPVTGTNNPSTPFQYGVDNFPGASGSSGSSSPSSGYSGSSSPSSGSSGSSNPSTGSSGSSSSSSPSTGSAGTSSASTGSTGSTASSGSSGSTASSGSSGSTASSGSSASSSASSSFASDCLSYQNPFRQQVGVPDLVWSDSLAAGAQEWADNMAAQSHMYHSGLSGVGENVAMGDTRSHDTQSLFKLWTNEKQYFIPGTKFPYCTTGGDVGHYTQIVWKNTVQVGCGVGKNSANSYLCCRYLPAGNYINQYVY